MTELTTYARKSKYFLHLFVTSINHDFARARTKIQRKISEHDS